MIGDPGQTTTSKSVGSGKHPETERYGTKLLMAKQQIGSVNFGMHSNSPRTMQFVF